MLANEDLDLPRFRWFLDHVISNGVHGVFVLGTNSEFYALDDKEKQQIVATAVEHVNRRVPVLAGTGAESTREVIRLTRMAEREGADGVSVITPYFVQPSQSEIRDHYRRVAECTQLPVMLYSNPPMCGGVKIDVDTVAQLTEVPNIVGIKDSSGELQNTKDFIRVVPKDFAVMMGRDTLILDALFCGAAGAVPASANVAPALCVSIYENFQCGDTDGARKAQVLLNPTRMSLGLATAPGGVKAALEILGMSIGPSRSPVGPLSPESREKMRAALQESGLLPNNKMLTDRGDP
jgi:4-hydroxy-tetrahydrodipicolinate synthase